MTAILKKALADGQGFTDESHGAPDSLYALLKEMVENPPFHLSARQAAASVAILASMMTDKATRLRKFTFRVGVAGSANTSTARVLVNGTAVATLSIANDDADGTIVSDDLDVAVPAGARVELDVSAAATDATLLVLTAHFNSVTVEP